MRIQFFSRSALMLIGISIGLVLGCSNRKQNEAGQMAKRAASLISESNQRGLANAKADMSTVFKKFYSHSFSVKGLVCSSKSNAPQVEINFRNYTAFQIEAALVGLTITDKLGNTIAQVDLVMDKIVPEGKSLNTSYILSGEYGACKFRMDQLNFSFSPPFASVKLDKYDQRGTRTNDTVIKFSNGTSIRDFKGIVGYDEITQANELRKQIEYLKLLN